MRDKTGMRERTRSERFESVAAQFRDDAPAISERIVEAIVQSAPEWLTQHLDVARQAPRLTRASVEAQLAAMADGGRIPDACPPADLEYARLTARTGVPLRLVIDAYHQGFAVQWQMWFDLVERVEADLAEQRRLLDQGSQFFLAYGGWLADLVSEAYDDQREALTGQARERRLRLVRDVLGGRDEDLGPLGYDLGGHHLGLVLWGPSARAAAETLAARLGRRLLFVEVVNQTAWAWLGGDRPLGAEQRREVEQFEPPGTRIAVGGEERGPDGFRRTHGDALDARRAAWSRTGAVTSFDDVALEALASRDEAAARRFVARELRGIDGDDARSTRLRETLTAYFARAGNAAATAKALGIHEQTVAQRLTAVEERTGRPVAARRAELETALRLRRFFAARPPEDPGDQGRARAD